MINGNSFQRKRELKLLLSFCSSFMFAIETRSSPKQITEYRFGSLLEISDKFSTKLDV